MGKQLVNMYTIVWSVGNFQEVTNSHSHAVNWKYCRVLETTLYIEQVYLQVVVGGDSGNIEIER